MEPYHKRGLRPVYLKPNLVQNSKLNCLQFIEPLARDGKPLVVEVPNRGSQPLLRGSSRMWPVAEPIHHTNAPLNSCGRILKGTTEPCSACSHCGSNSRNHLLHTSSCKGNPQPNCLCRINYRDAPFERGVYWAPIWTTQTNQDATSVCPSTVCEIT